MQLTVVDTLRFLGWGSVVLGSTAAAAAVDARLFAAIVSYVTGNEELDPTLEKALYWSCFASAGALGLIKNIPVFYYKDKRAVDPTHEHAHTHADTEDKSESCSHHLTEFLGLYFPNFVVGAGSAYYLLHGDEEVPESTWDYVGTIGLMVIIACLNVFVEVMLHVWFLDRIEDDHENIMKGFYQHMIVQVGKDYQDKGFGKAMTTTYLYWCSFFSHIFSGLFGMIVFFQALQLLIGKTFPIYVSAPVILAASAPGSVAHSITEIQAYHDENSRAASSTESESNQISILGKIFMLVCRFALVSHVLASALLFCDLVTGLLAWQEREIQWQQESPWLQISLRIVFFALSFLLFSVPDYKTTWALMKQPLDDFTRKYLSQTDGRNGYTSINDDALEINGSPPHTTMQALQNWLPSCCLRPLGLDSKAFT